MSNLNDKYLFQKAYKKLKSSIYYDKTNLILRDKLVRFENDHKKDLDTYLNSMQYFFKSSSEEEWNKYINETILKKIDCRFFPKKLKEEANNEIITNFECSDSVEIAQVQSFIDLEIEGHILGVIWLLLVGWKLDEDLCHCYGNRIRKELYNEFSGKVTFSPGLFEPYFVNYESWRDTALQLAETHLENGEDILILTLDFTRFYYSIDMSKDFMDNLLTQTGCISSDADYCAIKRINSFIFKIITCYAEKYYSSDYCLEEKRKNILPIGFLPSNVLANCVLKRFDTEIVNGWNPIYFGRYVDDVLIVEKMDGNHPLYDKLKKGIASKEDIINTYFVKENKWGDEIKIYEHPLFQKWSYKDEAGETVYQLCKEYMGLLGDQCDIRIKNEKFKAFYFAAGSSIALLNCFRENISRNKSEFRYMPEDEIVFQKDDYSEIYDLERHEINKFRDIKGIQLDKFKFSKYLAKYKRISGLVDEAVKTNFSEDICQILNNQVIIDNYTAWEKILSILVLNKDEIVINQIVEKIMKTIEKVSFSDRKYNFENITCNMKDSLKRFLFSGMARTCYWDKKILSKYRQKYKLEEYYDLLHFMYIQARMNDKSQYPIWPELFIKEISRIDDYHSIQDIMNLMQKISDDWWRKESQPQSYKYYPYFINMYDLLISYQCYCMAHKIDFVQTDGEEKNGYDFIKNLYIQKNFNPFHKAKKLKFPVSVSLLPENCEPMLNKSREHRFIAVEGEKYPKLRIAVSNVKMESDNVIQQMTGFSNRSYRRYKQISCLVNMAIEHQANLLVMPECCVPIEWLDILSRTCAKNDLALVTGVEHIVAGNQVYNLVAVILPFQTDGFKSAHITFHSKNYFAPAEKEMLNGYRLIAMDINEIKNDIHNKQGRYELYKWHDFYFSVYCCFELTSIADRALFQSYVDAVIAIEWNKDVKYYSNILESLSRDLHCYCIQVNSSDFGDSRLTQPAKKDLQDILRVKGGEEPVILVGTIDIMALRNFQFKEFSLQQKDECFKPTPPQLDKDIVYKKIHGKNLFS